MRAPNTSRTTALVEALIGPAPRAEARLATVQGALEHLCSTYVPMRRNLKVFPLPSRKETTRSSSHSRNDATADDECTARQRLLLGDGSDFREGSERSSERSVHSARWQHATPISREWPLHTEERERPEAPPPRRARSPSPGVAPPREAHARQTDEPELLERTARLALKLRGRWGAAGQVGGRAGGGAGVGAGLGLDGAVVSGTLSGAHVSTGRRPTTDAAAAAGAASESETAALLKRLRSLPLLEGDSLSWSLTGIDEADCKTLTAALAKGGASSEGGRFEPVAKGGAVSEGDRFEPVAAAGDGTMHASPALEGASSDRALYEWARMQDLSSARSCDVSFNSITCGGLSLLSRHVLEKLTCLESLNLSHNRIGDAGVGALGSALQGGAFGRLRTLELGWNEIGSPGLRALALALRAGSTPALERLRLEGNAISDDGAPFGELAGALAARTPELRELSFGTEVGGNYLGDACLFQLIDVLPSLIKLQRLYLATNEISDAGAVALSSSICLGFGTGLQYVALQSNYISDDGIRALKNAAVARPQLCILDALQRERRADHPSGEWIPPPAQEMESRA